MPRLTDSSKAEMYAESLEALRKRLESRDVAYVGSPLVEQIDHEVSATITDLPTLGLPAWNPEDYFEYEFEGEKKYHREAIAGYLVRLLSRLNQHIRDSSLPPGTSTRFFPFIAGPAIRRIVERDHHELQIAMVAQCWKSGMVLAGSCIEGILFDLVEQNRTEATAAKCAPRKADVTRWTLGELVGVCTELSLIPPGVEKLSPGLKDYRNLVHPGVEIRENLSVEESEARIAVEILNILHRELSERPRG